MKNISNVLVFLISVMFFTSCVNDMEEIERVTYTDKSPVQILKNASIHYSDSGYVKSTLTAPIIEKYDDAGQRTVFPKGVEVLFYNKERKPESKIKADFGELSDNNRRLELKNNIVIISLSKGDTMYTEYLLKIPRHRDSVYSVSTKNMVIVRGNSGNFECRGVRANDNFSKYIFGKSHGKINYNESE